jgi:integrase
MGVHTALRICDLLSLIWDDVYDFDNMYFRKSLTLTEHKTHKSKTVMLNDKVIDALTAFKYEAERGRFLMMSGKGDNKPISRQQAHRIISVGAEALGFGFKVSCHSLRKTFGYLAWRNGVSPAIILKVYNHTSLAVTQRYLGITQDDLDDCYRKLAELL